jgi:hypothetical protein
LRAFPPLRGSLGCLVGPSLDKEVDLKLCTREGLRGTPLGLLPSLGERGGHPHNNRELPNNSKFKDFYSANISDSQIDDPDLFHKIMVPEFIPIKKIFDLDILSACIPSLFFYFPALTNNIGYFHNKIFNSH